MSFASLDDLWGGNSNGGAAQAAAPQAPQKVYAGGNAVQKVYAGGNLPQKELGGQQQAQDPLEVADAMLRKMAQHQQRQAAEIAHLRQVVAQSMMRAQEPARKGLTVMEITLIVLALVFILLVLFLISTVRQLTNAL
jgi:hypothetical protein